MINPFFLKNHVIFIRILRLLTFFPVLTKRESFRYTARWVNDRSTWTFKRRSDVISITVFQYKIHKARH